MSACPCCGTPVPRCLGCGEVLPAFVKARASARRKPRAIVCAGRTFPLQRAWYGEAMRVAAGELVWDPAVNASRFGARGGYRRVDPKPVLVPEEQAT